jgi:hypothetical protein
MSILGSVRDMEDAQKVSDIGDQLAAFADELQEWAELSLVAGLEGWPDDDWSDR